MDPGGIMQPCISDESTVVEYVDIIKKNAFPFDAITRKGYGAEK